MNKYILFVVVFLLLAIPARATVSCFSTATAIGHNTSSAINTTGATLLIAVTGSYHAVEISSGYISDSASNVWQYASVFGNSLILFVPQPITSTTHTFTFNNTPGNYPAVAVYACSGTSTVYPFAAQNGVVLSAALTTVQPGSVAPIESGDLIVTGCTASGLSASINDGFQTSILSSTAASFGAVASYLVTTTGSTINPTWTLNDSESWNCAIALFTCSAATRPFLGGPQINLFAGSGIQTPADTGSSGNGDGGPAKSAAFYWPGDIVLDSAGDVYFNDVNNNTIRVVNTQSTTQTLYGVSVCAGCVKTIAGTGASGCSGYGGAGTSATMGHTIGLAVDSSGNLYISDQNCFVILKLTPTGTLNIVAGTAQASPNNCTSTTGALGDNGPATSANLFWRMPVNS